MLKWSRPTREEHWGYTNRLVQWRWHIITELATGGIKGYGEFNVQKRITQEVKKMWISRNRRVEKRAISRYCHP